MKPIAVIQGIPRGKRSPPGKDLKKLKVIEMTSVYPPVGIAGYPGSGRKTLAYRFGRISEGPFDEEVPVQGVYGSSFTRKYKSGWGFRILLKLYIIDPWNMSPRILPLGVQEWNEFCCMVIVFDINDKKTFAAVPQYLSILREYDFQIQENFFIVGNKSDLRRADETRHTQVTKRSARRMAGLLGGTYHECSAKQEDDGTLRNLLFAIRQLGLKYRYVIK